MVVKNKCKGKLQKVQGKILKLQNAQRGQGG